LLRGVNDHRWSVGTIFDTLIIVVGDRDAQITYRPHNPFWNKAQKDREEWVQASNKIYGLNEPWSWYDKCTKRLRNGGMLRLSPLDSTEVEKRDVMYIIMSFKYFFLPLK
jgi:hypothetical protein